MRPTLLLCVAACGLDFCLQVMVNFSFSKYSTQIVLSSISSNNGQNHTDLNDVSPFISSEPSSEGTGESSVSNDAELDELVVKLEGMQDAAVNNLTSSTKMSTPTATPTPTPILYSRSINKTRSAALCAIAMDEEQYLDEWIDYNLGLNFTTIYIYDNSDEHNLQKWNGSRGGNVQVFHLPGEKKQTPSYTKCLKQSAEDGHTWTALFDIDEFLVLRQHLDVVHLLEDHCKSGSLGINWFMFGTSNHTEYQPIPVTKRFQYREPGVNQHIKVIVKLSDVMKTDKSVRRVFNPHYVPLTNGHQHDTNGTAFTGPFNPQGPTDVANLYHFHTKSQAEFHHKKCIRGRADIDRKKKECGTTPIVGSVFDDSAWQALKSNVPKYTE